MRCEVWTRSEGIGASAQSTGYQCFRYAAASGTSTTTTMPAGEFVAVDGGSNRAFRGASSSDNAASYYMVIGGTSSLDACKDTVAEVYKAVSESSTTVVACVVKSGHVRQALVHQLSPPGTSASATHPHQPRAEHQHFLRDQGHLTHSALKPAL